MSSRTPGLHPESVRFAGHGTIVGVKRAHAVPRLAALGACLVLSGCVLSGCSDAEEDRRADCTKITAALARTADPSARDVLAALREVRPDLKDDELADQVDTVIASGSKDLSSGGGDGVSDEEALRFAEAAERIRETCGASRAAGSGVSG